MSQKEQILQYLQQHGTITPMEALNKIGSFRLSARIMELREDGYHIETNMVQRDDKEFAEYELIQDGQPDMFGKPESKHKQGQTL